MIGQKADTRSNYASGVAMAIALAALLIGCSGTSTGTVPVTITGPTPVSAPSPPTVSSITASTQRIEAAESMQMSATVTNGDFPADQVKLAWTADPNGGTFSGMGTQESWQAPGAPAATPDTYTLTLTATARYKNGGQPAQYAVPSSVQVHYNDSNREITGLSLQFLQDFTTFSVSPAMCVRNFTDTCPGKADELSDITNNRKLFHILSGEFSVQSITYNAPRTFAHVTAPCTFFDIPNATGVRERVEGICLLTALYENWKWWLCTSNFQGISTTPTPLMAQALMRRSGG
jgi:hypothetical protein